MNCGVSPAGSLYVGCAAVVFTVVAVLVAYYRQGE
jgi:hypothetical protein